MERSNLHSYEIGVALKLFMEERKKKEGRESKKYREREKAEELSNLQCVHICMLRVYYISRDLFVTYNAVLTDSSLW